MVRLIYPHVLMADGLIPAYRRKHLIRELHPVVHAEAVHVVPDVGQKFRRFRGNVDRALAPEGLDPPHYRRVVFDKDQVQSSPSRSDSPGAMKVNETGLQELGKPRASRRQYRRTPLFRLHAPTAGEQGSCQPDVMLLDRLA